MQVIFWWVFFWTQIAAFGIAGYFGIFQTIYESDVSKISFVLVTFLLFASMWIGKMTKQKMLGQEVNGNTGWFLSELGFQLGLIGTLVGFIYTLSTTLLQGVSTDPNAMRALLNEVAKGIGTAGWTTLLGMIASSSIKLQMNNVESIKIKNDEPVIELTDKPDEQR